MKNLSLLLRGCKISTEDVQMIFRQRGHCEDRVNFAVLAFRSQGIPCRIDMVPHHGTSTGRHYWNATINTNHQIIPFEGSKTTTEKFILTREPAKVITLTYGKQKNVPAAIVPQDEIPEGFLRNYNFIDVTEQYWPTSDITSDFSKEYSQKLAYVAVLNGLKWQPVHWGIIEDKNKVKFSKMGVGVAYLPMVYTNGKLEAAGYPILLFDSKETKVLKPTMKDRHTIILKEQDKYLKYREGKSYKLFYWDNKWILAGEKLAGKENYLEFEKIPKESLLLMIPEYSQGKERPFYITPSGERIWW